MNATKRGAFAREAAEPVTELSYLVPSEADLARYVMEMSGELARLADQAGLPEVIGYLLKMASLASRQHETKLRSCSLTVEPPRP